MEQKDQFRALHLQELRNHMDIALSESAGGEGTDGELFMQDMLQDLDARLGRKAGCANTSK